MPERIGECLRYWFLRQSKLKFIDRVPAGKNYFGNIT